MPKINPDTASIDKAVATMAKGPLEAARAAKRDLWFAVRHAGRPGADDERKTVVAALVAALKANLPVDAGREVLWMLSVIGGDEPVETIESMLSSEALREDARMALERIPGEKSLAALQSALKIVPDDFKIHIAQSLRARGVDVPGLACRKLLPTKPTDVKPTPIQ